MWWKGSHAGSRGQWGKPRGSSILPIRTRPIGEKVNARVLGIRVLKDMRVQFPHRPHEGS